MSEHDPFLFLVGPQEKEFLVDGDLVCKASPVLNRLIKGPMRESHERAAKLPEVEPDTFQNFLSHTYSSARVKTHAGKHPELHFSYSRVIELMLRDKDEDFKCKQCECDIPLKFCSSFPLCQRCQNRGLFVSKWSEGCIRAHCDEFAGYDLELLCKTCLKELGSSVDQDSMMTDFELAKFQLASPHSIQEVQNFHFDIPLRAKELAPIMRWSNHNMHLPCTDLIEIGRLALFADLYNASHLFEATILGLYEELAAFDCSHGRLKPILELTSMIYQNASETRISDIKNTHILRRLVLEYIFTHRRDFLDPCQAATFFGQKHEILRDLFLYTFNSS